MRCATIPRRPSIWRVGIVSRCKLGIHIDMDTAYKRECIPDFPGYCVDTNGDVWSFVWSRCRHRSEFANSPKKMQPHIHVGTGYRFVWLMKDGKRYKRYVHRLVLFSLIGPPSVGQQTRHLNGVKSDNRVENLAWGTPKENGADKKLHGTNNLGRPNVKMQGEKHHQAILTDAEAIEIYNAHGKETSLSLSNRFGVCRSTIYNIWTKRQWSHIHVCPDGRQ